MELANYHILDVPIQPIFNHLFINRIHKTIKIDKSDFKDYSLLNQTILTHQTSKKSDQSAYQHQVDDKIYIDAPVDINLPLKQKIIRKKRREMMYRQEEKNIHKKYVNYLMQYMHKTNLALITKQIPPNLSVLETINEGDYVEDDQGQYYVKKDYPHYSNIIQVNQLPSDNPLTRLNFVYKPLKIRFQQTFFQMQDNCVLKLKQIYQFIDLIFKKSIQYLRGIRCNRKSNEEGNDIDKNNENHDFDVIGGEIGLTYKTCKLLYDVLNEYYNLQKDMRKGDQSKIKASKYIKQSLREILSTYTTNQTVHISHIQLYISLTDLCKLLHKNIHETSSQTS